MQNELYQMSVRHRACFEYIVLGMSSEHKSNKNVLKCYTVDGEIFVGKMFRQLNFRLV